jgi:hypothetical protein
MGLKKRLIASAFFIVFFYFALSVLFGYGIQIFNARFFSPQGLFLLALVVLVEGTLLTMG